MTNETKIGLMISVALILLAVLTLKTGDFNFAKKGYMIEAHFNQIDGVDPNAPVRLNGMEVGYVQNIRVNYEQNSEMILELFLNESTHLGSGVVARVKTMGLMGEKYIALMTSETPGEILQPGSVIEGVSPPDIEQILEEGQSIAVNIKAVTENLEERMRLNEEKIDHIIADVETTMANMTKITDNVHERLEVNGKVIDQMVARLHSASVNVDEMSADLKNNPWKLMFRSKEKLVESSLKK